MKRKSMIFLLGIIVLGQSLLLSGCWSRNEVEDLAILTGGTLDIITKNGQDQFLSYAVIMPPPTQGMQGDQPSKDGDTSDLFFSGEGDTFQDAVMESNILMPRNPSFSHFIFFIFGENAAKKILPEMTEGTLRVPGVRPNELFFVTKGEGFKILQAVPATVKALSEQFQKQQTISLQNGVSCGVTFKQFAEWLFSPDRDAVLPEVELVEGEKGKTFVIEGFGVFRGGKLVGWLNQSEARGYLLLTRNLSNTIIPIKFTTKDHKKMSYYLGGSKYKIESKMAEEKLSFKITIQTAGQISENNNYPVTVQNVKELEKAVGEEITKLPLMTIAKAKEYDSDFLGCMEYLHRHNPSAWKEVEPDWRESFRNADIEVEVKAKIVSAGMVEKSFKIKE